MAKSDTTDEIVKNRIAELIRNPTATDKGLEKILREKMGVVRKGEIPVKLLAPKRE